MDEAIKAIIDLAIRATKAEDEALQLKAKMEEANQQISVITEKFEKLGEEYRTTEGAWKYKRQQCEELTAKNDALTKEVEQLRAKLNAIEGLEAADRGVL